MTGLGEAERDGDCACSLAWKLGSCWSNGGGGGQDGGRRGALDQVQQAVGGDAERKGGQSRGGEREAGGDREPAGRKAVRPQVRRPAPSR